MNDVTTEDIITYLLDKIYHIAFISFSIAVITSVIALNLKEVYRSEAIIQIADSSLPSSSSSSSMPSGALGLASLAGIDLNQNTQSSSKNPAFVKARITSRSFFNHLVSSPGVLEKIFADKSFDFSTKEIVFDEEIYNSSSNEWVRKAAGLRESKPSSLEAHKIFLSNLTVSIDKKTSFIFLTYDHSSPFFAKELLELIFNEINALQKKQDLIKSTNELNYLTNLQSSNKLLYLEQSLSKLIVGLINDQMLANVSEEYLVEYIDEPYAPESRIFPRRTSLVLTVTAIGFVLTILSMLFYNFGFRRQKNIN